MKYHWYHFTGVDFNAANGQKAIFQIVGEQSNGWAQTGEVDGEKGNYDFLMGSDLDYDHPEVEKDVIAWGTWLAKEMPLRGIRFDAIKHYSVEFLQKFVEALDENYGKGWFFVGEFWKDSLSDMVSVRCPLACSKMLTVSREPTWIAWTTNSPCLMRPWSTTSARSAGPMERISERCLTTLLCRPIPFPPWYLPFFWPKIPEILTDLTDPRHEPRHPAIPGAGSPY